MNLASVLLSAACVLGAAAISGCTVSVEPGAPLPPPPVAIATRSGEITVNWLVAGSSSPSACAYYRATEMEVVIYDSTGQPVVRETTPCGNFSITLPLDEGTYSADVTLLDRRGRVVSSTKTVQALEVIGGTNLAVNIDFPRDSLL
ncbi:Hypothetical protein A7982_11063 [Minicystis rosea]|nr:Hypothetical protein A7982_11063 [Minicystis rosea]